MASESVDGLEQVMTEKLAGQVRLVTEQAFIQHYIGSEATDPPCATLTLISNLLKPGCQDWERFNALVKNLKPELCVKRHCDKDMSTRPRLHDTKTNTYIAADSEDGAAWSDVQFVFEFTRTRPQDESKIAEALSAMARPLQCQSHRVNMMGLVQQAETLRWIYADRSGAVVSDPFDPTPSFTIAFNAVLCNPELAGIRSPHHPYEFSVTPGRMLDSDFEIKTQHFSEIRIIRLPDALLSGRNMRVSEVGKEGKQQCYIRKLAWEEIGTDNAHLPESEVLEDIAGKCPRVLPKVIASTVGATTRLPPAGALLMSSSGQTLQPSYREVGNSRWRQQPERPYVQRRLVDIVMEKLDPIDLDDSCNPQLAFTYALHAMLCYLEVYVESRFLQGDVHPRNILSVPRRSPIWSRKKRSATLIDFNMSYEVGEDSLRSSRSGAVLSRAIDLCIEDAGVDFRRIGHDLESFFWVLLYWLSVEGDKVRVKVFSRQEKSIPADTMYAHKLAFLTDFETCATEENLHGLRGPFGPAVLECFEVFRRETFGSRLGRKRDPKVHVQAFCRCIESLIKAVDAIGWPHGLDKFHAYDAITDIREKAEKVVGLGDWNSDAFVA